MHCVVIDYMHCKLIVYVRSHPLRLYNAVFSRRLNLEIDDLQNGPLHCVFMSADPVRVFGCRDRHSAEL